MQNMVAWIDPAEASILFQQAWAKRPKMNQKWAKKDQKVTTANLGRLVLWLRIFETLSPHLAQRRALVEGTPKPHRCAGRRMLLRPILPDLRLPTPTRGNTQQPCVWASRFGVKMAKNDRNL